MRSRPERSHAAAPGPRAAGGARAMRRTAARRQPPRAARGVRTRNAARVMPRGAIGCTRNHHERRRGARRSRRAPLRRDAAHARSSAALPRRRADERDTGNGPPPTRHLHSRAPPHTARTHAWRFPPQRNAPLAVAPNVAAHGGPPPRRNTFSQLRRTARRAGAARADRQTKAARHDALAIPVQIAAPGVGHSRSNDEVNDETQQ